MATALPTRCPVATTVVSDEIGAASSLKMVYAAWSKGTAALLLAIRAVARAHGVEDALLQQWLNSVPELPARLRIAAESASTKGWRWVGEMEEITRTFSDAGIPEGFMRAAAEVYRRVDRTEPPGDDVVERVVDELLRPPARGI